MSKYGFSFLWKREVGILAEKQWFAQQTGISTSKAGLEKKVDK